MNATARGAAPLIDAQDLSKVYHLYARPSDRLLQSLFGGRRAYHREFWSLRDVSLQVGRGETVGVIGRNGAGKSTLLQLIAGTLTPTAGRVKVAGRVAALLQLGSGFNPEFPGRENVFLNGSILGLPRAEIARRYDEIVDFAEIGDFVDQPVKTYSSGMVMRLAFAVSVCLEPEILIVDEALAVGDMLFQMKCFRRLKALKAGGASILFVSHDLSTVRAFCDRTLYLREGRAVAFGPTAEVVRRYEFDCYEERVRASQEAAAEPAAPAAPEPADAAGLPPLAPAAPAGDWPSEADRRAFGETAARGLRQGTGRLRVLACRFEDAQGRPLASLPPDEPVDACIAFEATADFRGDLHASLQVQEKNGVPVAVIRDSAFERTVVLPAGARATARLRFVPRLRQGDYFASLGLLGFPPGAKYRGGSFNLAELELCDHVEVGVAFEVRPLVRHLIPTPVLIEAALALDGARDGEAPA